MSYWWWLLILFVILGALLYIAYRRDRRQGRPPEGLFSPEISDWLAEPANARKLVIISWVAAAILGLGWWGLTHPDTPLGRAVYSFLTVLCVVWAVVGIIMGYLGLFGEVAGGISDLVGWARKSRPRKR